MSLIDLLLGQGGQGPPQPDPTPVEGVEAIAPKNSPVAKPGAGYNNLPELDAIHNVQAQYAAPGHQGHTGSGLGLSNLIGAHGTLRDLLGTLGDAFLVQSGHQPIHAQERYREQVANAGAGFENDPGGAASRIMATGAPNSPELAQNMYNSYQTEQLRKQQQEYTNTYREGLQQDREDRLEATKKASQDRTDDRRRGIIGGLLQGAAASGDPGKYAAARTQALKIKGDSSSIDDSEIPQDINSYQSTYGMSANQVARQGVTTRGQDLRHSEAQSRTGATIRGQDLTAGAAAARNATTQRGQDLTDKRANNKPKLTIPGLTPKTGGGQAQQYQQIHTFPSGRKAGWNGKAWVPIQ